MQRIALVGLQDRAGAADGLGWDELLQRVSEMVDGDVLRCVDLLSMQDRSKVAGFIRGLLQAQLERARAAGRSPSTVVENMQRVVGPLDPYFLGALKYAPSNLAAGSPLTTLPTKSVSASESANTKVSKKRRRVELAGDDDEDEFLRLAEIGNDKALVKLQQVAEPQRLLCATSEGGLTALHHAAFAGNERFARRLLELQADVNRKTDYGFTPLMAAVQSQNLGLLTVVLEHRADVNARTNFDGRCALHFCAVVADTSLCQALLGAVANPQQKDSKGKTPLDKAKEQRNEELVHMLEVSGGRVPRLSMDAGPEQGLQDIFGAF